MNSVAPRLSTRAARDPRDAGDEAHLQGRQRDDVGHGNGSRGDARADRRGRPGERGRELVLHLAGAASPARARRGRRPAGDGRGASRGRRCASARRRGGCRRGARTCTPRRRAWRRARSRSSARSAIFAAMARSAAATWPSFSATSSARSLRCTWRRVALGSRRSQWVTTATSGGSARCAVSIVVDALERVEVGVDGRVDLARLGDEDDDVGRLRAELEGDATRGRFAASSASAGASLLARRACRGSTSRRRRARSRTSGLVRSAP